MSVFHRIDESLRQVVMAPDDRINGAQVARLIAALVRDRPELAGWDWIHDLRQASGEADNTDVSVVAEAFAAAGPQGPCFTVFVTHDPGFPLWARTMDPQFPGRIHLTAPDLESAQSLVARRRRA